MKYFKELINEISKEDIIDYYNNQNHTQKECTEYFGIGYNMLIRLLKYYDIHKDGDKHIELIRKSKLERYGDCNYNNRDKAAKTCQDKYGVDNIFKDTDKIKQSYLDKLGVDHPMHRKDIKDKVISKHDYSVIIPKSRQTYFDRTGYDNPSKNPECIKKNLRTRLAHGVFNTPGESNLERRAEKILNRMFNSVKHKYRDIRYGRESGYLFECDFYIPELDLFIEINAHPSHGKHPFDQASSQDLDLKESLTKSDKRWDKAMLDTWVYRDVEKLNCALKNNLNYIIIYPYTELNKNIEFNNPQYSKLIKKFFKKLITKKS